MANESEFFKQLGARYTQFEDELDATELNETRQLWHTPTELFRPYYGEAIARSLVEQYKLTYHPYRDLVIYEMGAGNGTMMLNYNGRDLVDGKLGKNNMFELSLSPAKSLVDWLSVLLAERISAAAEMMA